MRTSDDLSSATLMAVRAIGSVCWGDQAALNRCQLLSEAWGFGRGARCVIEAEAGSTSMWSPHGRSSQARQRSSREAALASIEVAAKEGWSLQIVALGQHARWESAEAACIMNDGGAAPGGTS